MSRSDVALPAPPLRPARVAAAVLVALAAQPPAAASADDPPAELAPAAPVLRPAADVLADQAAAMGGEALLRRIEGLHYRGTLSMPLQGISGTVEAWQVLPDRLLARVDLGGIGTMETGSDGTTAWAVDPMMGPRLLRGPERAQLEVSSSLVIAPSTWSESETLERGTFEGRPAWKLRLVPRGGTTGMIGWYDAETGHQVGLEMTATTPMGAFPVEVTMGGFRDWDGLTVPTRIVQRTTAMGVGIEQVLTIDLVDVDPETVPTIAPPPEVRALMAKSPSPAEAATPEAGAATPEAGAATPE